MEGRFAFLIELKVIYLNHAKHPVQSDRTLNVMLMPNLLP